LGAGTTEAAVVAIVLAAGRATRMGRPKHTLVVDGQPMVLRVVRALRAAGIGEVVVVLRADDTEAPRLLAAEAGVRMAVAPDADEGRAASLRAGVRSASPGARALLVALADQPFLLPADFAALVAAFARGVAEIVRATYADQPGMPVLFASRFREELLAARGEEGGRGVIARHPDRVALVPLDPARGRDLDRPEDLPQATAKPGGPAMVRATMERTLCIIKPDAVARSAAGKILDRIESSGLRVVALRMRRLERAEAERFYAVHRERPFFKSLVGFMSSGPIVVAALEGPDAIGRYRKLMGATNPAQADPGTLRRDFATDVEKNAVHGSDSAETARQEVAFFFGPGDFVARD
jgi:nucleoside-diphosphate kinase